MPLRTLVCGRKMTRFHSIFFGHFGKISPQRCFLVSIGSLQLIRFDWLGSFYNVTNSNLLSRYYLDSIYAIKANTIWQIVIANWTKSLSTWSSFSTRLSFVTGLPKQLGRFPLHSVQFHSVLFPSIPLSIPFNSSPQWLQKTLFIWRVCRALQIIIVQYRRYSFPLNSTERQPNESSWSRIM